MDTRLAKESLAVLREIRQAGGCRADTRSLFEPRDVSITFEKTCGSVLVRWGNTIVRGVVTGEIVRPRMDRGNEGDFRLQCRFSGMAGPELQRGTGSGETWMKHELECSSMLMKLIKDSKIIDVESLCVVTGEKVWKISCEVDAINNDGNLFDAAFLAAVAALKSFRREELTVENGEVKVHDASVRAPIPLSITQVAVLVSFAQFRDLEGHVKLNDKDDRSDDSGDDELDFDEDEEMDSLWLMDATRAEEKIASGFVRIAIDKFGQILGVFTMGGATISASHYSFLVQKALEQSKRIVGTLETEIAKDLALRLKEQTYLQGNNYQEVDARRK